ncbi:MAG: ABC transporter ATP-binding protein [Gammaproteobacteria bacterium]|nr:ABC transporter ATP-binding protein [Gammaproteobacteria bacterium]
MKNPPNVILHAQQVVKYFTEQGHSYQALETINFQLKSNEIVAIIGQSGSGKSTFLRLLAGLLTPCSGELYFRQQPITGPLPQAKLVFQNYALLPWMSVFENIAIGLKALNLDPTVIKQRVEAMIEMIGLSGCGQALPTQLSGGMNQRVGFARALVTDPEILLLDEPFSALDAITSRHLRQELLMLWQQQQLSTKAIVMVTHDIREAIEMADRIILFASHPGRIVQELTLSQQDREQTLLLEQHIYEMMMAAA